MRTMEWKVAGVLAICWLLADPALADEGEAEEFSKNKLGGFVGVTGSGRRENGLTLALIYERRFTERFGLGAEAERVFGDLDFWLFTVPLSYHYKEWKFFAGPGIEKLDGGDTEGLLRIGAEYGLEVNERWEIAPTIAVDFVDSETEIIVGLVALYEF